MSRASQRYCLALAIAIGIAFLPGTAIVWAVLAAPFAAALWGVVALFRAGHGGWALLALLAAALVVSPVILLAGGLVLLMAAMVSIWVYPSALNIAMAYGIARLFPVSALPKAAIAICASALLGLAPWIPELSEALAGSGTHERIEIARQLVLPADAYLGVEFNAQSIHFRKSASDPVRVGGNEGCMCMYWEQPATLTEDIEATLKSAGVRYKRADRSGPWLAVRTEKDGNHLRVEAELRRDDQMLASYVRRLRFAHDPYDRERRNIDSMPMRLRYLAENTFWRWLVPANSYPDNLKPLRQFLDRALVAQAPRPAASLPAKLVASEVPGNDFLEERSVNAPARVWGCPNEGRDTVAGPYLHRAGARMSFKTTHILFEHGGISYSIPQGLHSRVLCSPESFFVLHHQNPGLVKLVEVSGRGVQLGEYVVELPLPARSPYDRREILELEQTGASLRLGIYDVKRGDPGYRIERRHVVEVPLGPR